ncbi:hypothetical protein [Acinetobacter nosocomialis]|uniref:hypothetical protein n=1 Tax=Acinetobacter nosocomialis TaxID=106654 RepID=UPI0025A9B2BB|nr:hypothetical protein [Acinetobacter nosocomialis]MDM9638945.1 hypothetical protein [Acinetobacter nosocomialis]
MGTDVNPVAWENAEITAYALIRNPNSKNLLDYYLEFGSYLDKKYGEFSVSSGEKPVFRLGDRSFILNDLNQPYLESLTRILYELFYKHQF